MQDLYERIESLSFDEFAELLRFIDQTRKNRAKVILDQAQQQVARLTPENDPTVGKKSSKSAKPAKYRDPKDATNTWSGYGRQPEWMKDYIADGGNKDDLLIG